MSIRMATYGLSRRNLGTSLLTMKRGLLQKARTKSEKARKPNSEHKKSSRTRKGKAFRAEKGGGGCEEGGQKRGQKG